MTPATTPVLASFAFAMLICSTSGLVTSVPVPASAGAAPAVYVLNTQLRGIIDPDIEPSAAYGHVQIKLSEQPDGQFQVDWKGRIFNPAAELILGGSFGIIDPDIAPVFDFFDRGDAVDCGVISFDSAGIIDPEIVPAAVAHNIIINPEIHEARFFRLSGGNIQTAVQGTFGAGDPETPVGFIAPDTNRVRCEI